MIVLADNDVLFKLAQCDLFAEFLSAFGVTASEVRILKLARYSTTSKKHRKQIGDESFARLTAFLATVGDITVEPDPASIATLTDQTDKNIDAGEAALFAVCPSIPESVIVTGDKKSLTGLAAAGQIDAVCAALCRALNGRVFCFEQVLARILDHTGYDAIRTRLIRGRECDQGLAQWLGSGLDASESGFREGLTSYLNEARRTTASLLAP